jgi:prevent-host-death family protein
MPVITDTDLRDNVADVLRRVEAGEQLTITVAGRPVAKLGPVRRPGWVSGPELSKDWKTPAPEALAEDVERFPGGIVDNRTR